ncbi:MAG: hypothetical protein NZ728_02645 [Oleiphilaceae bacterium]|nr:hypothetical protein [Oleiphilaceae bacterium]
MPQLRQGFLELAGGPEPEVPLFQGAPVVGVPGDVVQWRQQHRQIGVGNLLVALDDVRDILSGNDQGL